MAAQTKGTVPAVPSIARRVIAAAVPWYDWGRIEVWRFDTTQPNGDGADSGDVRFFDLQWFGIHVGFQVGRTPRKGGC